MSTKSVLKWRNELLTTLVLIIFFIAATKVIEYYIAVYQQTFRPKPLLVIATLIPMLFGGFLAVPHLLAVRGIRCFNWKRLLVQGLPAFVLAVPVLLWAWPGLNPKYVFWWPLQSSNNIITILAGVWFGWIVVSSIEKQREEREKVLSSEPFERVDDIATNEKDRG